MSVKLVNGRTTADEIIFQKLATSPNSLLFADADNKNLEKFSLEVSLGEGWNENYSPSSNNLFRIVDEIKLRPHGSIVVQVKESIKVPFNRYGILLPTGSMFQSKGIMVAPAKVEPAFEGKLKLRLFNTTNTPVTIKIGEKLASIIFLDTESTERQNKITRTEQLSEKKIPWYQIGIQWTRSNKSLWVSGTISGTATVLVCLFNYFLVARPNAAQAEEKLRQANAVLEAATKLTQTSSKDEKKNRPPKRGSQPKPSNSSSLGSGKASAIVQKSIEQDTPTK